MFEDKAEFGVGMGVGEKGMGKRVVEYVENIEKDREREELKRGCEK